MSMELLFQNRKLIGENILKLIKDNGYTKNSFSTLIDVSRPTLDKLIKGEIDNLTTFKKHIQKIMQSQNINEEQLLNYTLKYSEKKELVFALSDNAPENHALKPTAQEMFGILEDIVHMYELYYN
ncbi:helix-turn-helix domain-containing protein [Defluviitalea raffinosedens]|uniref:Helix-turn-helix domain-containing protein n=1 Tax=Defluviitalea raffinosedens TaxID=1450156 RepID=A0A7C8LDS3_9FIRM|nr:helix-turn-helix transcriptional regulator [Defluviitalea raffinosedens]KAE9636237.1 helix-turn-helix domain-containing protein [Defluviitalea raffinosedens]MBM7685476.1 putative XRE-type DNA-binding protein [Defluviitalea raffinosedens]HHW66217.1 helix-turn-helix transcriptional regulator [Candidatus Epulonipiscium sp.]